MEIGQNANKKSVILSSIYLGILFIAIWWMSSNVVWLGDDIDYKYMMKGEIWQSWGYINSIEDFFKSQFTHYTHVNGRFIAHSLVQLFNAHLGQQVFAVCNAIVYTLFALFLGHVGLVRLSKNSAGILTVVNLSVLCFITKMMPTCQIGYIWGMLANIIWLTFFFRTNKPSWFATISMSIAGIIVGNWQESVSIGICAGIGIWWIWQLIQSRKSLYGIDWRRTCMMIWYVIGTATNCLAPSTIGRTSSIHIPLPDQMLIAAYSFPAIIILLVSLLLLKSHKGNNKLFSFKIDDTQIPNGVIMSAMLTLIAFNVIVGIYSNRQLFGANLFASILLLRILPMHKFCVFINAMASLTVIAFWSLMAIGIDEIKKQYDEIVVLHSSSEDGSVYFDRKRVMTLGFPLRAKYYEDILGQFDNDLHHSMMKDFKHVRKGKTLKLKPSSRVDYENIQQYAPGHFNVTLKEPPKGGAPREVIVFGHYLISRIKASPRRIEVTKYSNRYASFATAVIIPEFPFFAADSVIILPPSNK